MRAFVSGASGFLGHHIVEELLADGISVIAFNRESTRARAGVEMHLGDVRDRKRLLSCMPENVDFVFHAAADTSHWRRRARRQWSINVGGTAAMVDAALARSAKSFVHTSSIAAYGFHPEGFDESAPSRAYASGISYFRSKYAAELEVQRGIRRGLAACILNPANLLGPGDERGWSQLARAIENDSLPGVPPGAGGFCSVQEVARMHRVAGQEGAVGRNYLLGGTPARFLDLVQAIAAGLGKKSPRRALPAPLLLLAAAAGELGAGITGREPTLTTEKARLTCGSLLCSSERAVAELGYRPATDLTALLRPSPVLAATSGCHRRRVQSSLASPLRPSALED